MPLPERLQPHPAARPPWWLRRLNWILATPAIVAWLWWVLADNTVSASAFFAATVFLVSANLMRLWHYRHHARRLVLRRSAAWLLALLAVALIILARGFSTALSGLALLLFFAAWYLIGSR